MSWIALAVSAALGGIVQTVTGFGAVVTMMLVFPYFFDMIDAPTLALAINLIYCGVLCAKYLRHIDLHIAFWPTLAYSVVSFVVTGFVGDLKLRTLVILFAVFLMVLSVYLLVFSSKVKGKPSRLLGFGCGIFSGLTSGLFAIGGPPMAPYFLAASKDHEGYVANMQFMFVLSTAMNIIGRIKNGIFHYNLLPYVAGGTVCILVGMVLGERLSRRINADRMKVIVYTFVGISGLVLLLQQL